MKTRFCCNIDFAYLCVVCLQPSNWPHTLRVPNLQKSITATAGERIRHMQGEFGIVHELRMSMKRGQRLRSQWIPKFNRTVPAGAQHQLRLPRAAPIDAVHLLRVLLVAQLRHCRSTSSAAVRIDVPQLKATVARSCHHIVRILLRPGNVEQSVAPRHRLRLDQRSGSARQQSQYEERSATGQTIVLAGCDDQSIRIEGREADAVAVSVGRQKSCHRSYRKRMKSKNDIKIKFNIIIECRY